MIKKKWISKKLKSIVEKTNKSSSNSSEKLTPLQQKMSVKLNGAKFRYLNEKLYTTKSTEAFDLFQSNPNLFQDYHLGFRYQVSSWPVNPIDIMISSLKSTLGKECLVLADMGCGEAGIAKSFVKESETNLLKIHSFDLVKANEFITPCNILKTPLPDNSCDIVIFCLSLMGVEYMDFIREGKRILRNDGEMKIAEVKSRFSSVDTFINVMKNNEGLDLIRKDESNKMFVLLDFCKKETRKKTKENKSTPSLLLKPCVYKKR